jgi:hypothetical protein
VGPELARCVHISIAYYIDDTHTWGWGEGQKKYFYFPNILRKQYFFLSTLLNSNKKTFGVNIDLS